jgi:hypothetical protein
MNAAAAMMCARGSHDFFAFVTGAWCVKLGGAAFETRLTFGNPVTFSAL